MLNFTRQGFQFDLNKPMVPKIMMIATRPKQHIIPIFQTHKILSNLPPHMLEPL